MFINYVNKSHTSLGALDRRLGFKNVALDVYLTASSS